MVVVAVADDSAALTARAAHAMQQPESHGTNLVSHSSPLVAELPAATHFSVLLQSARDAPTAVQLTAAAHLPCSSLAVKLAAAARSPCNSLTMQLPASIFLLLLAHKFTSSTEQLFFIARAIIRDLFFLLAIYEPRRIHAAAVVW